VEIGRRLTGGNVAEINFDFRAGGGQRQRETETEKKFSHSTQLNKKCLDDKESVGWFRERRRPAGSLRCDG
jgi:hypothetical protein